MTAEEEKKQKEDEERQLKEKGYITYDIKPHDVIIDVKWEWIPQTPKPKQE